MLSFSTFFDNLIMVKMLTKQEQLTFKNPAIKNPDPSIFRHGFRERIFIFSVLVRMCTTVFISCRLYLDYPICLNAMLVHSSLLTSNPADFDLVITDFAVQVMIFLKYICIRVTSYKIIIFNNPAVFRSLGRWFFEGQLLLKMRWKKVMMIL